MSQATLFPNLALRPKPEPLRDITINRNKGNEESAQANARVHSTKRDVQDRIWAFVKFHSPQGVTSEEISTGLNLRYTTVSARVSELKANGRLIKKGTRLTSTGSVAAILVSA